MTQIQQHLEAFMPSPIEALNPEQKSHYNFLQGQLRKYKQLRRFAANKERVDQVIDAYRNEIKKLVGISNGLN